MFITVNYMGQNKRQKLHIFFDTLVDSGTTKILEIYLEATDHFDRRHGILYTSSSSQNWQSTCFRMISYIINA
jgi:hypothetical protein